MQKCGKKKEFTVTELDEELYKEVKAQIGDRLYELKQIRDKSERNDAVTELFDNVMTQYCTPADANSEARCEPSILKRILSEDRRRNRSQADS